MDKNKVNYRLVNIGILVFTIYLIYHMGHLWMGITDKIIEIVAPFFAAFVVAYALYPAVSYLQSKKVPKTIAIFLIIGLVVGLLALLVILIAPMLFSQLTSLITGVIKFLKDISVEYNVNFDAVMTSLNSSINTLGEIAANGIMSIIGTSLGYISIFFISFSAAIYFLIDFEKIRNTIKNYLYNNNKKMYYYVRELDIEMKKYLIGFLKISIISFFEYTLAFLIIGHPNAVLLGFLASIAGLIPYFGGIITNIIACVTAFVISPALFIKTLIVFMILSQVDGYVINPLVYGKSNELHPLVVIFAVFAAGILMGVPGIIMSLPLAIIIITTYSFFKKEINAKTVEIIDDIKGDDDEIK